MKKIVIIVYIAFINLAIIGQHKQGTDKVPIRIIEAFACGNSFTISEQCCENIEISILGNEGQYLKTKAKEVLDTFFNNNKPQLFSIVFEGGKKCSQFAVGKLTTNQGLYRVNLLIKDGIIQQLRIENYDEN
jgi:hypothetical protein